MRFYLTRHCADKWTNLELTSKWIVRHKTQVFELTTQRLARHRTQILNLTSKRLVFSMNRIACHRIYVIESTTDRLTCHKIRVYDLTSNQLICQMPSPCPLTFKVSSIKHWTLIPTPPPFHYPNAQHQIPTRHIPTAQRGNLRPPTD